MVNLPEAGHGLTVVAQFTPLRAPDFEEPRSLRRQLAADASGFRALVDAERRERARELLTRSSAPVTGIALELGFADASAFSHACRRWFGCAPLALRGSGSA